LGIAAAQAADQDVVDRGKNATPSAKPQFEAAARWHLNRSQGSYGFFGVADLK